MNKICFINGSPRGKASCSKILTQVVLDMLDKEKVQVYNLEATESMRTKKSEEDFKLLKEMNSIIFVFPLYIDAIPSNLLEYMNAFEEYIISEKLKVDINIYAIINNGFIEGSQNINALKIMCHYAKAIGCSFKFGIGIGAGEFIRETMEVIPLKSRLKLKVYNALLKMAMEIENPTEKESKILMTNPSMPKTIFMLVANKHWLRGSNNSKKNLSKKVWG